MDIEQLAQLGPALGSVVVIGIICWKLLELFSKNGDVLGKISENMNAHTIALNVISKNVEANTEATEKMVTTIENAVSFRGSSAVH